VNPDPSRHQGHWKNWLDRRPIVVAIAGPNGAGKSTFYEANLKPAGLRFLSADVFASQLQIDPREAMRIVGELRKELVALKESFVFETVFSDPVGNKLNFLKQATAQGYTVVLVFIGIPDPATSEQRVSMRVSQGGHDVPTEKLFSRFPRILANLKASIRDLPLVVVFDNSDLKKPYRLVAVYENGQAVASSILHVDSSGLPENGPEDGDSQDKQRADSQNGGDQH
jgi:predicted ABC-type ATPase